MLREQALDIFLCSLVLLFKITKGGYFLAPEHFLKNFIKLK